jgi:hypothetical protein
MKKVFLSFCTTIIMLCSCTSDYGLDVLEIGMDFNRTWQQELSEVLEDYSAILDSSSVSLLDYKQIDYLDLDTSYFFNNKSRCHPIYFNSFDRFTLVPYAILKTDTAAIHFKYEYLLNSVMTLLSNIDSYNVVELKWQYNGEQQFTTYSLFDKRTNELMYDNILTNIITPESKILKNKKVLTRSETSGSQGNSNQIIDQSTDVLDFWNKGNELVASVLSHWEEYGTWNEVPIRDSLNKVIGYSYQYQHIRLYHYSEKWSANENYITATVDFQDLSGSTYGMFKRFLWVGPNEYCPTTPYEVISQDNMYYDYSGSCNNNNSWYTCQYKGFAEQFVIAPGRAPIYF